MNNFNATPNTTYSGNEFQTRRGYIRRNSWEAPIATDADVLKALTATSGSVVTHITPSTQPDYPRTISVTPGGTTADVNAGSYVLTGTDIRDNVITETLTFADNATLKQVSLKAFKTVTDLLCPVQDGAGATFSIGVEDSLGLDRVMTEDSGNSTTADGVHEATRSTFTYDEDDIALNTMNPNTALDGSKDFVTYYISRELRAKN